MNLFRFLCWKIINRQCACAHLKREVALTLILHSPFIIMNHWEMKPYETLLTHDRIEVGQFVDMVKRSDERVMDRFTIYLIQKVMLTFALSIRYQHTE